MALKILRNIIIILAINFASLVSCFACGWYEYEETYRIAFFRAELSNMSGFRPFYYSATNYNSDIPDIDKVDRYKNCKEWIQALKSEIPLEDVYEILYEIKPEDFKSDYDNNKLAVKFPKNLFIKNLLFPKNKELLIYLDFAKKMESMSNTYNTKWESWNEESWDNNQMVQYSGFDFRQLLNKIYSEKNIFLKERYAFQLIKASYYNGDYLTVNNLFDTVLNSSKSIVKPWAFIYKALSVDNDNKPYSNYMLSLAFNSCEEKKLISMMCFSKDEKNVRGAFKYTKNDEEKAILLSIYGFRKPGPTLDLIKEIKRMGVSNEYFATLIMREVNKIEDWIFTPKLTSNSPSVIFSEDWYDDYEKAKSKNFKKDVEYTFKLIDYLKECFSTEQDVEMKNYLAVSIAHLCFITDQIEQGFFYLKTINNYSANSSIVIQKSIQALLVKSKSNSVLDEKFKSTFYESISQLEGIAKKNFGTYKILYSLTKYFSSEYKKKGEIAISGLLFMQAERYKDFYENVNRDYSSDYDIFESYYWRIAYFDRYATLKDMDELIALISKKDKTNFEKYLCSQKLPDLNACKDLKATLALRKNDFKLAESILSEIPSDFWLSAYEFKNYLNEDPFVPKRLSYVLGRNFDYKFNKLEFVKKVNHLMIISNKTKDAETYLKLGHVFYNCSYYGNSWMMINYEQSSNYLDLGGYGDYIFGEMYLKRVNMQDGNYYKCSIAKKYYLKALEYAKNDEQKAMACLMIHCCKENEYYFQKATASENIHIPPFRAGKELRDFYEKYKNTEIFMKYNCPGLEYYIANK